MTAPPFLLLDQVRQMVRLLPHPPIETAILNRFRQMLLADMLGAFEIGDGAGDLEDARVAAGGEAEALGDEFEEAVAGFVRFAMLADEARRHLGVAVDAAVLRRFFWRERQASTRPAMISEASVSVRLIQLMNRHPAPRYQIGTGRADC